LIFIRGVCLELRCVVHSSEFKYKASGLVLSGGRRARCKLESVYKVKRVGSGLVRH
jgi:hypothetical protein